jgi:SecD/SecF fusion protein
MHLLFYTLILPLLLVVYVLAVRKSLPPLRQAVVDTAVILGTCVLLVIAIIPPEQTIKLGRDLRGGVSLIYSVNIPEGADKKEILTQTIKVLKQRVNPQGVLDLAMSPQGEDRIEVVMPLPGETVREAQRAYREKLDDLVRSAHLTPRELELALSQSRAAELGGTDDARRLALAGLQTAYDRAKEARRQFEAARSLGTLPADKMSELAAAAADAELAYETARAGIRTGALSAGRLTRILGMPTQPLRDGSPGERARALEALKAEFPTQAAKVDALVAAYDAYSAKRTTLDDPEDLKRLLRGAGVLDFRIAVTPGNSVGVNVDEMRQQLAEGGPNAAESPTARWFRVNDLNQWANNPVDLDEAAANPAQYFARRGLVAGKAPDGHPYILLWTDPARSMTHEQGQIPWSMKSVRRSTDELGRPSVAFQLDTNGGTLMGTMTGAAVGQPMAIVLDNQVYTAPNLNNRINDSGQIMGNFSDAELDYLVRVLASGSLGARLSPEPVSVSVLGPAMGKDNLQRGLHSVLISVGVTFVVMILYYFVPGIIANISLLVNALIIFFAMSLVDANFTLPGLAGIALTIAIAVDANVLIYERLREELVDKGEKLVNGIEIAMSRAATAIIDGNITNLIVVVVLYWFAGAEVKGFALVMGIGVFSTLAAGLIVTHVLMRTYALATRATTVATLPIKVPALARALRPNVDWLRYRFVFWGGSIAVALVCIVATVVRGSDIFETEFRGGTSMTMSTRMANPGEPAGSDGRLLVARPQIEETLRRMGAANAADPVVSEFRNASVLTVGEQTAKFEASTFQIKIPNPAGATDDMQIAQKAVAAVVKAFEADMDIRRPVTFKGLGERGSAGHAFRITRPNLGEVLERERVDVMVDEYMGGVAVVVEDISPPLTADDAAERIRRLRAQPDFSDIGGRTVEVIGLDPAPGGGFTSLAVLAAEPEIGTRISDTAWQKNFADKEWHLVSSALSQQASLEQVSSISPAVARDMATQAALAVVVSFIGMLIYIWVRFGSLLYSVATVIGVLFNVAVCLGALALSKFFAETALGPALLFHDFRIDLNVVAALLIVIGYSLNDTIVILDRVRENRGKLPHATRRIINDSINQTFSRTILTGGCTAATPIVLYILGGPMMQPFAYTFLVGLIAGTFSSVAIAAPLVFVPDEGAPQEAGSQARAAAAGGAAATA